MNKDGELCVATTSTVDPRQVWPGSNASQVHQHVAQRVQLPGSEQAAIGY